MLSLITLIHYVLEIYKWVLFAFVIVSLLISLGIVNAYNRAVNIIFEILTKLTEPALKPIRRLLPDTGSLDLSPLILFLLIWFAQMLLWEYGPRLAAAVQG